MTSPSQTKKCPHCAEEINAEAKKCKHCGEFLDQAPPKEDGTPARKLPYWRGLLTSIAAGFGAIVLGALLSMIVIGMIVGIPLMLGGVIMIIASPIMALYVFEGDCPSCGNKLTFFPLKKAMKCRQCKQRSVLQGMRVMPVRTFIQTRK